MSTRVDEISDGIFRISTPVPIPAIPGGFTFNQILIRDEAPLLFHTGLRGLFEATRSAIETVLPVSSIRYLGYSHFEADECGAMNAFLALAPGAVPLCGRVGAMVNMGDTADRPPRALADGEELDLGRHRIRWIDTPHVPHGWDAGLIWESATRTLLCSDLFTQPGMELPPATEGDILGPSEAMRPGAGYFSCLDKARATLGRLAELRPGTLATMHGSSFRGDGAALLRALAAALSKPEDGHP
jgi:flavorubredoxin